jgi:hypothetical protein
VTNRERRASEQEAKALAEALGTDPDELLELAALGFSTLDTSVHHRLIISSSAREKCGKTHFSIATTPEPIAFIDFDVGTEGVVNKFPSRKIIHKQFNTRKEMSLAGEKYGQSEAEKDWEEIQKVIRAVIKSNVIRTMVVDTATELWEIARLSEFGRLDQVKSQHHPVGLHETQPQRHLHP